MAAKRHKEALTVAKNAHKTLGANPRTLTVRLTILLELAERKIARARTSRVFAQLAMHLSPRV